MVGRALCGGGIERVARGSYCQEYGCFDPQNDGSEAGGGIAGGFAGGVFGGGEITLRADEEYAFPESGGAGGLQKLAQRACVRDNGALEFELR